MKATDDGQISGDLPKPNTDRLKDKALNEAYIELRENDIGDNNDSVNFILNVSLSVSQPSADLEDIYDWDSKDKNKKTFWVTYLLAGYQAYTYRDNDSDSGEQTVDFGYTAGDGGSIVFLESMRDHAVEKNNPPEGLEQDTVVHEIGHNFPDTEHPIERLGLFTDETIDAIRSAKAPK